MPYKQDLCGIYKIVNTATGQCYVGHSQRIKKRLKEHFRLLRNNNHPNSRLQNSCNKYGISCLVGSVEIECKDLVELNILKETFFKKEAWFEEKFVHNIVDFSKAPMQEKTHSDAIKEKIRLGRRASTFDYKSPEYRATLSKAQVARFQQDPKFVAKLNFILNNSHMSYAERARQLSSDLSSVRKLALKYKHLKEFYNGSDTILRPSCL